ncbi:MAG: LSU ribosomal protein L21p [uncultured Sphingomonadaceae bacterium]|uniref:Large ribosomal subunit protein bL21 n=1 Tax=uncultured Sphingomonadaceae bacterium TaxID=169976 RepID=A0A6J4TES7_9SPHN|nr:MAG: LSU ribosomal protein L21p [uncultured Sphingomonadaceae bacterium]
MFAVVRTGGKQYRVAAGDKIVVDRMGGEAGDTVRLGDVLFAGSGGETRDAAGLLVSAEIIAQAKADKVIVFKKKRRHNYRRKNGHRQQHTILRITAVGDDTIDAAQARQQAAVVDTTPVADTAPASAAPEPTEAPVAGPAGGDAQPAKRARKPQAPLKIEGTESPMVDTPAGPGAADEDKVS